MTRYKYFLLNIFITFALMGCTVDTNKSTILPAQTLISSPTISYSSTNTSSLSSWCKDWKQANGLPVTSELKQSHIIYQAFAFDKDKHVVDQVGKLSIKDGSNKLLSDSFPKLETNSDQYDVMGSGFSLNSADNRHVAIWGHWYESSNPDGTYSLIIRDKDSGQDVDILRTSPAENIQGGWAPDGNHFAFTSYKNSDKYYSVVYSVNADGTGLKQLTERMTLELLERPRWSPNGNKIAVPVWGQDGGMYILIINFVTGNVNRYKVSPIIRLSPSPYDLGVDAMSWSPDSQWFAYISEYYEHNGIELLNTESGEIYCVENNKIFGVDKLLWHYDNP